MLSLRIDGLCARRNGEPIFAPVDLKLTEPGAVEVTGPNGAGKTTLLRVLAGLYGQYEGSFELPERLYQGHRLGLDELDSVAANLVWHCQLAGQSVNEKDLRRALAKVGLLRLGLTPLGKLSQGQQRRVCMARWLLSDKPLWLLDEPVTSLDESGQRLLTEIIDAHIARGRVVIYSSHTPLPVVAKQTLAIEACA